MKPGIAIALGVAGILSTIAVAIANANQLFVGHPFLAYWFWGASFALIVAAIMGWIFNSKREKTKPLSLQQRTFAAAQRLRKFIEKHGPRPPIPKTQAWDDTVSGDYWGYLFREVQQIQSELAQKGLTDSRLDDNFRIERPNDENLRAIVEGLRFLASKLDG